jgi:integrase
MQIRFQRRLQAVNHLAPYRRLTHVLDDAVHDGPLVRNPCSRRTAPPVGHVEQYCPTTEQVWQLHEAMPEHLAVAVLLGAFAGLRVSEAVALRIEDVDFTRGVVFPKMQWTQDQGWLGPLKTNGSRQRRRSTCTGICGPTKTKPPARQSVV